MTKSILILTVPARSSLEPTQLLPKGITFESEMYMDWLK